MKVVCNQRLGKKMKCPAQCVDKQITISALKNSLYCIYIYIQKKTVYIAKFTEQITYCFLDLLCWVSKMYIKQFTDYNISR